MKIKKIKKIGNNKYKIEFTSGDALITYDQVILKHNVLLKSAIDESLYIEMLKENDYYSVYNKAIKYATMRLRSEQEMRKYISKYIDDSNTVNEMINQLKRLGLINEYRYIRAFVEDKINLTNDGPKKIFRELEEASQMPKEQLQEVLDSYPPAVFEEKLKKIIDKKVRLNHKDSKYILKQKLERNLFELGYDKNMIEDGLSQINVDETSMLEKELEKIYGKLKMKYYGNELVYQLKQRLYNKGFKMDMISCLLEEFLDKKNNTK